MYNEGKIWVANNDKGEKICILPKMANRHGLVAGATGTGKTVTLKVLAESFSDMGVPVFLADVKGDLAGMIAPGNDSEDMQKRIAKFGLAEAGFSYQNYPTTIWDIYGEKGIQLRTTISEMGPLLLARVLGLNDLQSDILNVVFKIADDEGLLLIDTKDLKAMLNYVDENSKKYEMSYGRITTASTSAIIRAIVSLESAGGDIFFGEPALNISDWLTLGEGGKGMINILDSESLINNGKLYSTFLLWLMSELFETLPEVGDMEKPKMVFFFDEAHLLFNDSSKLLLEKIEQVVKLIRSKGIGIYFCTQNPRDIPDGVLAQLGNKIEHGLRAYTPADQKTVKAAAESFRVNPEFDTYETLLALGTGEAVVSFLGEDGVPGVAEKVAILPPASRMGSIADSERETAVKGSLLYSKYAVAYDPDSAYEFLQRYGLGAEAAAAPQEAPAAAEAQPVQSEPAASEAAAQSDNPEAAALKKQIEELEAKIAAQEQKKNEDLLKEERKRMEEELREEKKRLEEERKEYEAEQKKKRRAIKSTYSTAAGTVGREVGKTVGDAIGGKFGKTLGGNVGASLGRGILSTFFKD